MAEPGAKAIREARVMFAALERDAEDYLSDYGAFRCRKKLANGTVITVSIKNPPLPAPQPSDGQEKTK